MSSNSRTSVSAELGLGLVPDGDEPEYMDFDAELTDLLSQA